MVQSGNKIIKDPRVEQAMLKVDRAHYCPSNNPYQDSPHGIGYNATISAPHMHAYALEALCDRLVEGARVLDVGSGSGYLTACFAHLVGPTGRVYGVEHIKELVDMSLSNLKRDCPELLETGRVTILRADGRAGLKENGPYDAIHVGAAADGIPEMLIDQLKEGGRMVIPVKRGADQMFESIDKLPGGQVKRTDLLRVIYVPLTDALAQLGS
ncbi:-L-isoaspartate(D-aspartate) O-methyltransferase-like isoform X1 [Olea europaea subsp. europaea]|uniref:Protein-L-isoaspartate O-methyltransferase n=1 Tax=Olea europaea subsp. europaea TaxID=158383 RepID=A0A8S0TNE6_OLEEU|nr:-L-isoaspartate(D-aspartate) O-methyltransferase-like isoform X1 [Olea europaea subsp. europaea]